MNSSEIRQVVTETNRRFCAAVAGKDYAGMATFYTEQAKLVPPDAPIVSGRKAIEEFWRTMAKALGLKNLTLNTVDVEVEGDMADEIGEAVLTLESGQAKAKYLVVWRRDHDGQWRLHRDIWNMPSA